MSGPVVMDGRSPAGRERAEQQRREVEEALEERSRRDAVPRLATVSAKHLIANPPAKPVEVIPGLLPAGVSILAAAPKVGKSWLAYQEAVAVATGGEVLDRRASKGSALYLALEDGEYRAWSRVTSVLARTIGSPAWPDDAATLDIAFLAERGDAMVDQVEAWLEEHPDARAVLIDTLQKVRPVSSGRRNQYELDVEDVGRILELAKRHPTIAVPIVHHARKMRGDDYLEEVSGTYGLTGTGDTILFLRRKRGEPTGTLDITGKDIAEATLHLRYDGTSWETDATGGVSDKSREVFDWLTANGEAGPAAIGAGIGVDRRNVGRLLDELIDLGSVVQSGRGRYRVAVGVSLHRDADDIDDKEDDDVSDDSDDIDDIHDEHDSDDGRGVSPVGSTSSMTSMSSTPTSRTRASEAAVEKEKAKTDKARRRSVR